MTEIFGSYRLEQCALLIFYLLLPCLSPIVQYPVTTFNCPWTKLPISAEMSAFSHSHQGQRQKDDAAEESMQLYRSEIFSPSGEKVKEFYQLRM